MANEPSPTSQTVADIFATSDPDRTSAATAADRGLPPPKLIDVAGIKQSRNDQAADLKRLEAIGREVEQAVGRVDAGLREEVSAGRIAEARDQARRQVEPIVGRMRDRAAAARVQAPLHSREAVLLRQRFKGSQAEDAVIRSDWRERLRSGGDSNLVEVARYAASTVDLALVATVSEVARSRELDLGTGLELETILGSVPVRASDEALAALEEVEALLLEGELAARAAATGWLDPADELEVALRSRRAGAGLR